MSSVFDLHKMAHEGIVFYKPELMLHKEEVQKYFPPRVKEANYDKRPKMGASFTTAIINKIVSTTLSDMEISSTNQKAQSILDKQLYDYEFKELITNAMTTAFTTGTSGVVLVRNAKGDVIGEVWDGRFLKIINDEALVVMYDEELEEDGSLERNAIYSEKQYTDPKTGHVIVEKLYDNVVAGQSLHNLPFSPFSLFRSIDRCQENVLYGRPYHFRYKHAQMEYQKVFSGMLFDIQIMKNVWKTNKYPDPNNPLTMSTDQIIFLGADGTLEQAIRELDFLPEKEILNNLKQQISDASQVPSMLFGIEDVGRFPSGVTLTQLYLPYSDLIKRVRPMVQKSIEDLSYKIVYANTMDESAANSVEVKLNTTINPSERSEKINETVLLLEKGVISAEEARGMLSRWLT